MKINQLIFLTILLVLSACNSSDKTSLVKFSSQNIIGGELVYGEEFTNVVALIKGGDFHCSGVLISEDIVLTAAHCLAEVKPDALSVYVGQGIDRPKDNTYLRGQYAVYKTAVHPSLKIKNRRGIINLDDYNANDVGLVFLEEKILDITPARIVSQLEMVKRKLKVGKETTVVGYGYTSEEVFDGPRFMKKPDYGLKRKVDLTIKGYNNHEVDIRDEGKDSCYIDSGGPALVKMGDEYQVFALVSGSNGKCAENEFPVYYSLVFDSICWIAFETGLEFDDVKHNCDRNYLIEQKCRDLPKNEAKNCAKTLSDLIFESQIELPY